MRRPGGRTKWPATNWKLTQISYLHLVKCRGVFDNGTKTSLGWKFRGISRRKGSKVVVRQECTEWLWVIRGESETTYCEATVGVDSLLQECRNRLKAKTKVMNLRWTEFKMTHSMNSNSHCEPLRGAKTMIIHDQQKHQRKHSSHF